jgi:hypothetical protein
MRTQETNLRDEVSYLEQEPLLDVSSTSTSLLQFQDIDSLESC